MAPLPWANVSIITHPVIQERLTVMRDRHTDVPQFRRLIVQIARLMAFELTRDYPVIPRQIETPMGPYTGCSLAREITLVPILRAGLGMAEGIHQILPAARMGHLGIFRDEKSLQPVVYYQKLPPCIATTDVIVIDPMLATAGSLSVAIDMIKKTGATSIKVLCLIAAPEGIEALNRRHADIPVFTAAVDARLDERGYIIPGLGDAGDRLFGTA